jgi:hypothetical protein
MTFPEAPQEFFDMFAEETLHPDLQPYVIEAGSGLAQIKHPLIYAVPYFPATNKMLNAQYAQKLEMLKTAEPRRCIFLHERPYRLDAFLEHAAKLTSNREWWQTLSDVWIDSENIWQNSLLWKRLLKTKLPSKSYFMNAEERKALKALPEKITVYRGCIKGKNENGISWTLGSRIASSGLRRKESCWRRLSTSPQCSHICSVATNRKSSFCKGNAKRNAE